MEKGEIREKRSKSRRIPRMLSWVMVALLVMIVVPVGALMFVISGVWSAVDRVLLKFSKEISQDIHSFYRIIEFFSKS